MKKTLFFFSLILIALIVLTTGCAVNSPVDVAEKAVTEIPEEAGSRAGSIDRYVFNNGYLTIYYRVRNLTSGRWLEYYVLNTSIGGVELTPVSYSSTSATFRVSTIRNIDRLQPNVAVMQVRVMGWAYGNEFTYDAATRGIVHSSFIQ